MNWSALTASQKAEQVRALVQTKGYTYSQAAQALGTTRLSIAGVVDRADIRSSSGLNTHAPRPPKLTAGKAAMQRGSTAIAQEKARRARARAMADQPEDDTTGKRLLASQAWDPLPNSTPTRDRDPGGCRWPIGNDRPFLWCNEPTHKGVYCAAHHTLSCSPAWLATQKEKGK